MTGAAAKSKAGCPAPFMDEATVASATAHLESANSNDATASRPDAVSRHQASRRRTGSRFRRTVLSCGAILIMSAVIHAPAIDWAAQTLGLPDSSTLSTILERPLALVSRNSDGSLEIRCTCELPISSAEVPQHLRDALIATEDRRFFVHSGIDWRGLVRAAWRDITTIHNGSRAEGASTVTQQLAKTVVGDRRSFFRKFRELIVAKKIEALYSKKEIIDLYLNRVYFGHHLWGIEAASRFYFRKRAKDLSAFESAMLVGMLKAPATYDPLRNPKAARQRAGTVLKLMVANGVLKAKSAESAKAKGPRNGKLAPFNLAERYYLDWIKSQFSSLSSSDLTNGNEWRVSISLDTWRQAVAAAKVAEGVTKGVPLGADQAALVSMDTSGMVTALVGGRDYSSSQFNRATQALRQPGSTYKIAVYLAALEAGYKPTSTVLDLPVSLDGWRPNNDDGRFRGRIRMIDALAESRNAATVWLAQKVGLKKVSAMANRLGLPSISTPSDILGTAGVHLVDLTAAFATIAAKGCSVRPQGIIAVLAHDGSVVHRAARRTCHRVLNNEIAARFTQMLEAVVKKGTGRRASLGINVAGKTGTSQAYRDSWFVGFAKGMVAGVWFGNDQSLPTSGVAGGSLPAVTWKEFARVVLQARPH